MKDSGIDWLGEIPEEWGINRLKYISEIVLGKMLCNEDKGGFYKKPYLKSKNIQWLKVDVSSVEEMWFATDELDLYRLKQGDLILSEGGEVGKTCIWNNELKECYIQNSAHKVTINTDNYNRYFLYLFNIYGDGFESMVFKISIAHLTKEKLMNVPVVIPSLNEQKAIANYLDKKCKKIDKLISLEETAIIELKEYKKSIIQKAVTKGIIKCRKLKNSGIDWIGEIPEEWETLKIKFLATEPNTIFIDGDWIESPHIVNEGIRYLTTGNVGEGVYKEQGAGFITKETFDELNCLKVFPEDLVISRLNEPIGRSCILPKNEEPYYIVAVDIVILRPDKRHNKKYLMYVMNSPLYSHEAGLTAKGTTMQRISRTLLGNIVLPIPSFKEQKEIVEYLDKKTNIVDNLISLKQQKITELKEYKKSLIYEYVTGKKEVSV